MSTIRTLLMLALLVLAPPAAGAKNKPALPDTSGWLEARTTHFTIYSNAKERATRKTAIELERFREALGRITRGLELDAQVPTTLLLFRNDKEYAPYRLDADGQPLNVAGYFLSGPFQNYITMDGAAGAGVLRVVYHEYFHAVMSATLGDLPLWLNEGLAEYFSTFQTRGSTGVVEIGHPIVEHVQYYRQVGRMHWPDVFRVTADSPSYNEGERQGAFYAQSWLAVHYLNSTGGRVRALGRYLTLLRDGGDAETSLQDALGMDSVALGAAVGAYAETGSSHITLDLGVDRPEVEVKIVAARPAEVLFRLGDLLARSGPAESARVHLEAARAAGRPAADVEGALGVLAARLGRKDEAAEWLRAAVASNRGSVESHVLLATLLVEEAGPAPGEYPDSLDELHRALLEARKVLEAAVARQPRNVPAIVGIARTYLLEGDTDPGIEALQTARELRPLDLDIIGLGACLLARGGHPAGAWRVVQTLRPRDPARADDAEKCLFGGTLDRTRELLDEDDRDGARRMLTSVLEVLPDGDLRAQLDPIYRVVDSGGRIVMIDAPTASPDAGEATPLETYNASIDLINAGKSEEALAQLEAFLDGCDAGERLCDGAAEVVAKLRQRAALDEHVAIYNEAIDLINAGRRRRAREILVELEPALNDPDLKRQVQGMLDSLGRR